MTVALAESTFKEIIASEQLTLVCFSATWCAPCQTMKPILHRLQERFSDKLTIVPVDVDQNLDLTVSFQIMGVPTLMLFRNSELLWRYPDVMQERELEQVLAGYL